LVRGPADEEKKKKTIVYSGKSEAPSGFIVRDAKTGEPVKIPISVFPLEFHPRIWCENAYWRFSGLLTQDEVMKYMRGKELSPDEAHKLGDYILIWVQNSVCVAWLFMPQKEREGYFKAMLPVIAKLHELLGKCKSREEVEEMMWAAMEAGLDPF